MALKRKRSSQTFSSPLSDISTASHETSGAIPSFYNHSKPISTPIEALHTKPTWSWPIYDDDDSSHHYLSTSTSSHLNSRTRKRHRDDRPDEQVVYGVSCWLGAVIDMSTLADVCRVAASTVHRLFEAQRRHPHAAPVISQPSTTSQSFANERAAQKSTLHSFWRIPQPQPPVEVNVSMVDDESSGALECLEMKCEDCDGSLRTHDAMELDEEMAARETVCCLCRRHVCDTCAVLGNERVCLGCASGRGR